MLLFESGNVYNKLALNLSNNSRGCRMCNSINQLCYKCDEVKEDITSTKLSIFV